MSRLMLAFLCLVWTFAGTASGVVFEDRCQSVENWTFIDYSGKLQVDIVNDLSCPPGYGPQVMNIHGDVAMGLAEAPPLQEGTFIVLYKEKAPAVEDADGVVMVWAQYDLDTSAEHNTKIKRPHVWLEQDNDLGLQFRVIGADGKEFPAEERVGVGLVTDSWNQTNWIWQKVQIKGNQLRAKFWPAEKDEPTAWAIETNYDFKGDRFGLRINSGSIRVAYFAADAQDIHPQTPPAYLFSELERVSDPGQIQLKLFTNAQEQSREKFELVFSCEGKMIEKSDITLDIPKGHYESPIILMTGDDPTSNRLIRNEVVKVSQIPSSGLCQVLLTNPTGDFSTKCSFEIVSQSKLMDQFGGVWKFLNRLDGAIHALDKDTESYKSLRVISDAAAAHLKQARTLLRTGKTAASEISFRFVIEALAELRGYKGLWLKELGLSLNLDFVPDDFEDNEGIGEPKHGVLDFYSPDYQISFDNPTSQAKSMVMGRSYEIDIPWSVQGGAIDRDFNFKVRLVNPLGNRVVAQSDVAPEIPTHLWKPGKIYKQRITLDVLAENAVKRPAEPVVLDELHNLLVTVIDPESGARVLLGNQPGDQIDRVGTSFLVDRFYVSSSPLEIGGFEPDAAGIVVNEARRVVSTLRNCGDETASIDAVLTVATESGRVVFQKAQSVSIAANSAEKVEYDWSSKTAGNLTIALRLMRDGVTLTEASRELTVSPPAGGDVEIVKQNHVEQHLGRFFTPVMVNAQTGENPVMVRVYADNRLVGEKTGSIDKIVVEAEPWFGYYDIVVDCGSFNYEKRVVATVVETKGKYLLVNGEPFIVKGVNVHGLDSGSPERTANMMRIMRELGFNAWRGDYPARWQMELAYELSSVYTVLAPFSCARTPEIFGSQVGPPLGTARELTRLFIDRYKDSAGVLLWNSCNEIQGENIDFLLSLYPLYKAYDPYQRPVHYANLYGQDLWQGQDAMGVNYYFGEGQTAADRQILIQRSLDLAVSHDIPAIFCEYNSFQGAIHSTGVEAMEGLFTWGVEQAGMSGGFLYMRPNSTSHPGVMDGSFNTHKIFDEAIIKAFADARINLLSTSDSGYQVQVNNKRYCTLRQMTINYSVNNVECAPLVLDDVPPKGSVDLTLPAPADIYGPDFIVTGTLEFVTHYGFMNKVPFKMLASD